ncbi:MAG: hypothetical protein GKR92_07210 [Gammaproteobacteria bacterium]|nr:MAG: hypothetical protein GKR92_07210 [Gammaproteobacteria bacterium]
MAKCVVCSKSAGPFHSLHKSCLPEYQGTRKCLHDVFSDGVSSEEMSVDVIANIRSCKSTAQFLDSQFNELVAKAWHKQADIVVKDSSYNLVATKNLLCIADEFGIDKADDDDYKLVRLLNAEYLDRIQNNQFIEKSFPQVLEGIELGQGERVVWEFKETAKSEPQRHAQEKQWTVFSSVLNNILMRKRYNELAIKIEKSGVLIITNQGLFYKINNSISQTKYSEIHSLTPMKNGVRVQANLSGAMPDTYVTGDGRFTYALLQYAQGLNR